MCRTASLPTCRLSSKLRRPVSLRLGLRGPEIHVVLPSKNFDGGIDAPALLGDRRHAPRPLSQPFAQILVALSAGAEPGLVKKALGEQDVAADLRELVDDVADEFAQGGFVLRLAGVDEDNRAVQVDAIAGGTADEVVDSRGVLLLDDALRVRRFVVPVSRSVWIRVHRGMDG